MPVPPVPLGVRGPAPIQALDPTLAPSDDVQQGPVLIGDGVNDVMDGVDDVLTGTEDSTAGTTER